jgi:hypothetical protein
LWSDLLEIRHLWRQEQYRLWRQEQYRLWRQEQYRLWRQLKDLGRWRDEKLQKDLGRGHDQEQRHLLRLVDLRRLFLHSRRTYRGQLKILGYQAPVRGVPLPPAPPP